MSFFCVIDNSSEPVSLYNLCSGYELTIYAMLNLIDLLINEYQHYSETVVLEEAEQLFQKIYQLVSSQKSSPLLVNILILQTHFATIKNDYTKAEQLLQQAHALANKHGLEQLEQKVKKEKEIFMQEIDKITQRAQNSSSIYNDIEESRLKSYIISMLKHVADEQ